MRRKEFLESLQITVFAIHGNHGQRSQTIEEYQGKVWHCGHYHMEKKVDRVEIMFENFGMVSNNEKYIV